MRLLFIVAFSAAWLVSGNATGAPPRAGAAGVQVCEYDPKGQGLSTDCMSSEEWCIKICTQDYVLEAAHCTSLAIYISPAAAAICHGSNTVTYGACIAECHIRN